MKAQDIIMLSRVAHVRELKREIERLKVEGAAAREECDAWRAHIDMALLAAMDLREEESPLEIWDGWNLILGNPRAAQDRPELIAQAQATGRRIWIVLDGKEENVRHEGCVRISYTGGEGEHRADRFIIAFVRMAKYLGLARKVRVRTNDKSFRKQVERLGATCVTEEGGLNGRN